MQQAEPRSVARASFSRAHLSERPRSPWPCPAKSLWGSRTTQRARDAAGAQRSIHLILLPLARLSVLATIGVDARRASLPCNAATQAPESLSASVYRSRAHAQAPSRLGALPEHVSRQAIRLPNPSWRCMFRRCTHRCLAPFASKAGIDRPTFRAPDSATSPATARGRSRLARGLRRTEGCEGAGAIRSRPT